MGTLFKILFLVIILGGIIVGIILVGQKQLLNQQAAELSSALLNLRPTEVPSPTPGPDAGSLAFTLRFQGISTPGLTESVSLTLKQGEATIYGFTHIAVSSRIGGVYSGKIEGVNPGVYDVFLKGDTYLTRKYPEVVIKSGKNSFDFSSEFLIAGDFDGNNIINVSDIGMLSSKISSSAAAVDTSSQMYDLDGNGVIGSSDMDIMLSNYKGLEVAGQ